MVSDQYVLFPLTPEFLTLPPHFLSLGRLWLTRASPNLPRVFYAADSLPPPQWAPGRCILTLLLPSAHVLHLRLPDSRRILSSTAGLPFFSQWLVCYPVCLLIISLYLLNADCVTSTVLDLGARRRHTRNEVLILMKITFWWAIE